MPLVTKAIDKSEISSAGTRTSPLLFMMASIMTGYPDETFLVDIGEMINDDRIREHCSAVDDDSWRHIFVAVRGWSNDPVAIDDLRSGYIDLFDRGRHRNALYETEYGMNRAFKKGPELADIAGFYRAFGLRLADLGRNREMIDHISVELEFYAFLLMKESHLAAVGDHAGFAIVRDGRRQFLHDHLGRFVSLLDHLQDNFNHPFYTPLLTWCGHLINAECAVFGVDPDVLEVLRQPETETFTCGCGAACGIKETSRHE